MGDMPDRMDDKTSWGRGLGDLRTGSLNNKQAANHVISALVFTLDLILSLISTIQPCNLLKMKPFHRLSFGGGETIKVIKIGLGGLFQKS